MAECAACRQVARDGRDKEHEQHGGSEGDWIAGADPKRMRDMQVRILESGDEISAEVVQEDAGQETGASEQEDFAHDHPRTSRRPAPSAIRTPISLVRRATAYDISP